MATVTAISTKGGGSGKKSLDYICRDDKTDNKKFVTALNCSLPTAYQEFKNTREMYNKTDGIKYYHFVQSHPSGYNIAPELAHKIAVEFAERAFPGHEVVVATHTDADHIHSHFVLNAVNAETGLKYHSNKFTLQDLRQLSDEICQKYGVTTLSKPEIHKQSNGITNGEYRVAMRGESWKMNLINTIDAVMKRAKSKKQFRFYMKQCGYDVKWEDSRKYITYTCPNGRRCRDNKLHGDKYRKENMEYEFKTRRIAADVRQGIVGSGGHSANSGGARFQLESADRIEPTNVTGAVGNTANAVGVGDESRDRTGAENSPFRAERYNSNLSGVTESGSGTIRNSNGSTGGSNSGPVITGWEAERAIWLETERARRVQAQAQIESCQVDSDLAVSLDSIVGGVTTVATLIDDEPADDTEYAREHIDSKALAEEREWKEAHGIHMG